MKLAFSTSSPFRRRPLPRTLQIALAAASCAVLSAQSAPPCGSGRGGDSGLAAEYRSWNPNWNATSCVDARDRGSKGLVYQRSTAHKPAKASKKEFDRGSRMLAQGRVAEALDRLREAVRLDPLFVDAHAELGEALARSGQLADAEAEFERAIALEPNSAILYSSLAAVLMVLARPADAERAARRSVELDPGSIKASYLLAVAQVLQNRVTPQTIRDLRAAAAVYENAGYYLKLAETVSSAGQEGPEVQR